MVAVKLGDDIVVRVPHVIVKVGEVAFLAPGSAGPVVVVIGVGPETAGDLDAVCGTPFGDLRVWPFVTQPDVVAVREVLLQHRRQCSLRHGPSLGGRAGDNERNSQLGHRQSLVDPAQPVLVAGDPEEKKRQTRLVEGIPVPPGLAGKIHGLALSLLTAGSLTETLAVVEAALRTAFDADQSVLVYFGDPSLTDLVDSGRFFRPMRREDPALQPFATFLASSHPRCGQVRDSQRDFLFGPATNEVGSAALVPLGEECRLGFLAIGSVSAERFHPAMSFDFLARMGELVAEALKRY